MNKLLNIELNNEILKEPINFEAITKLLKEGANPLDPLEYDDECVLIDLFCEAHENYNKHLNDNLPKIIRLFIDYGMDPKKIETNDEESSPLWELAFICSKNALISLKLLIDNGLNKECANDFIEHFIFDIASVWCGPLYDDSVYNYVSYGFKMIMLCASYKQILEDNNYLQRLIDVENNEYDLSKFREYENYEIMVDTSTCFNINNNIGGATISIIEKETNNTVWNFKI